MEPGDNPGAHSGLSGAVQSDLDQSGLDQSGLDQPDQSGVLLLRAWVQEGYIVGRIMSTMVGGGSQQQMQVVVGVEAIQASVRKWLNDLTTTMP